MWHFVDGRKSEVGARSSRPAVTRDRRSLPDHKEFLLFDDASWTSEARRLLALADTVK